MCLVYWRLFVQPASVVEDGITTARDGAGDGPCVRSSDGEKSIRQAESIRLANGTRVLSIRLLSVSYTHLTLPTKRIV